MKTIPSGFDFQTVQFEMATYFIHLGRGRCLCKRIYCPLLNLFTSYWTQYCVMSFSEFLFKKTWKRHNE